MLDTGDIKIDVDYDNKVQNIIDSVAEDEKAAEVATNKLNIILGKIAKDTTF